MKLIKVDRHGGPRGMPDKASSLSVGGHGCGNHSDMDYYIILYEIGQSKRIYQPTLFDI